MFNGTWSDGNQRGLKNLPGGNADCGQHAAGDVAGAYRVGSVCPRGGVDQVPAYRRPMMDEPPGGFIPAHGLIAPTFMLAKIPANAQGVAYVNVQTGAFHYAKLTRQGQGLTQTDANQADNPGMGGTYIVFSPGPGGTPSLQEVAGQRGVQPVRAMQDRNAFINYCDKNYSLQDGFFFFCKFA